MHVIIPPGKNASTKYKGSITRAKITRYIKKEFYRTMEKDNNYSKRWLLEIYFSDLKRVISEIIKARKIGYFIQELTLKVINYKSIYQK